MSHHARLIVAIFAVASPCAAVAADLPSPLPAPAPAPFAQPIGWEGFYAGSIYGAGFMTARTRQTGFATIKANGQTGGLLAGYGWQAGRFVYGVEGDITLNVLRGVSSAGATFKHGFDSLHSVRARAHLGYDFGRFHPFVAAGAVINESFQHGKTPPLLGGENRSAWGWTAGVGVDYRFIAPFFGPMSLRAEYLYEAFPEQRYRLEAFGPVNTRHSTHFMRLGIISRNSWSSRTGASSAGVMDWSGAYAGLIASGSSTRLQNSRTMTNAFNASGGGVGLYSGRNFQFGATVVGFESSTQLTSIDGGPRTDRYRGYIQADLRARVGYAWDRWLPYMAAGIVWTRSDQQDTFTGSQRGRIPAEAWTVGAGVDYRLSDQFSLRGEYLYHASIRAAYVPLNYLTTDQAHNSHSARFGVAYHFR